MSEKRRDHCAARIGSSVYILGGSYLFTVARIDVYNVATQRWSISNARYSIVLNRNHIQRKSNDTGGSKGTLSHPRWVSSLENMEKLYVGSHATRHLPYQPTRPLSERYNFNLIFFLTKAMNLLSHNFEILLLHEQL